MNFHQISVLYLNTLQKEFRSRTLLSLFVMTVGMIFVVNLLLKYFEEDVMTGMGLQAVGMGALNIFLIIIGLWSIFLSVLMGTGCIKTDLDDGAIPILLTFPVKRFEYLLARILGTWSIVLGYYLFSILLASLTFSVSSGELVFGFNVIAALLSTGLILLASVLLAAFIGLFLPKLIAFFCTYVLTWIITYANGQAIKGGLDNFFSEFSAGKGFIFVFHHFFPRLLVFDDIRNALLFGKEIPVPVWINLGHYVLSFGLIFFVMSWVFRRRNL